MLEKNLYLVYYINRCVYIRNGLKGFEYMSLYKTKFEGCLKRIQKPARYIGNEFNSVHKERTENMVSFAFCFPDVYEVGMSHLGIKILYHTLKIFEIND